MSEIGINTLNNDLLDKMIKTIKTYAAKRKRPSILRSPIKKKKLNPIKSDDDNDTFINSFGLLRNYYIENGIYGIVEIIRQYEKGPDLLFAIAAYYFDNLMKTYNGKFDISNSKLYGICYLLGYKMYYDFETDCHGYTIEAMYDSYGYKCGYKTHKEMEDDERKVLKWMDYKCYVHYEKLKEFIQNCFDII